MSKTPEQKTINRIAEVAQGIGLDAGEPAMEIAGQIVSFLHANPDCTDHFMDESKDLFEIEIFRTENGTLTFRALDGRIRSPTDLRKDKGMQQ